MANMMFDNDFKHIVSWLTSPSSERDYTTPWLMAPHVRLVVNVQKPGTGSSWENFRRRQPAASSRYLQEGVQFTNLPARRQGCNHTSLTMAKESKYASLYYFTKFKAIGFIHPRSAYLWVLPKCPHRLGCVIIFESRKFSKPKVHVFF